MNVSLTAELEAFVAQKVETGMYQTASEVVREGLRLLKEREQHLEALRRDVHAGFEAAERGDFTDLTADGVPELAERVKSRGLRRLEAERAKTVTR